MKITREIIINGISQPTEYELTGIELGWAFNEYQSTHDRNEILRQLRDLDYENLEEIPEEIMADLAEQVRDKMDALMDDAILDVIHKNEKALEPYKEKWKVFSKRIEVTVEKTYTIKARNEEEAEELWSSWSERHSDQIDSDLAEEIENGSGSWDEDDPEEDEYTDPDCADIEEGRNC